MRSCNFIGNLTKDPEFKHTNSGKEVCTFSLAVNGYKKDEVHFFQFEAWGDTAKNITKFFHKGNRIGINATAKQERWEQDGKSRSKVIFVVVSFDFCNSKSDKPDDHTPATKRAPY